MQTKTISSCLAVLLALGHAAVAQQMSDDEMLERFLSQREAFGAVQSGKLGSTRSLGDGRGLTLVTLEDEEDVLAETGEVAVQGSPEPSALSTGNEILDPNKPLVVAVLPQDLQVNLRIGFGFDSAAISPSEEPKLAQICSVMRASDIKVFRIIGHTDGAGSDAYNQRLSRLRAEEVARYLTEDCGIEAARLETIGVGEKFLYDAEHPAADVNRRVEFQATS